MIRLLQWLVLGHVHKWKIIRESNLSVADGDKVIAKGVRYVLQCEHCGNIKQRDIQ